MQIVSRKEAQVCGLRHYFTGRPCSRGHVEPRMTHNKACLGCHRERRAVVRATQAEKVKRQKAASYRRHRKQVIAAVKRWQHDHPEQRAATQMAYRQRKKVAHHPTL